MLNRGSENERNIGIFSVNEPAAVGESITFWSAGGGGYGDALKRPVEAVLEDVKDEYVTVAAARAQYGVVVEEIDRRALEYQLDLPATEKLRAELRQAHARD